MGKRFAIVLSCVLFSSLACSGPLGTPSQSSSTPTATGPVMMIDTLVSGLEIPWAMAFAPDGRIFVSERPGRIRIVKDGQLQTEPWLTLDVAAVGEGGLLGLELDPAFAQNRFVYVAYTYRTPGGELKNRLVRLREDPGTGKGVMDKVLLENVSADSIHDGGRVKFGPGGKLYWTVGDAGNPQSSQDLSSLNGKILRVNPDGSIPEDNPFPGSPVYSYGHRNPQGLAWQPGTVRLYATEHGPSRQDEVNYVEPGKNYGWPVIHGNETNEGMENPVVQSGQSETWAPSGAAFVFGGPWDNSMLFAGLRGETLYRLVFDQTDPRKVLSFERYYTGQFGRLRDVVQGPDDNLYILTNNRDGRGSPRQGDDRILRLSLQ